MNTKKICSFKQSDEAEATADLVHTSQLSGVMNKHRVAHCLDGAEHESQINL